MNQYPAKSMMDEMAKHGRYGDTMLVHMNPVEVAGIASLSPTGSLTINPVTGQPEAFLPLLAPVLGMIGGAAGLSTLGTAALTGIGTAAITGDIKRGLLAGLTAGVAGGIGDLFAGGSEAVTSGVVDAAGEGMASATTGIDVAGLASAKGEALVSGADAFAPGVNDALTASSQQAAATQAQLGLPGAGVGPNMSMVSPTGAEASGVGLPDAGPSGFEAFSDRLDETVKGMSPMQATMLSGIGAGQLAQMDAQDELEEQEAAREAEREEKLRQAYADLFGAQMAAQPNLAMGPSSGRSIMSDIIPYRPTMGMAEGGATNFAGNTNQPEENEEAARPPRPTREDTPMQDIGLSPLESRVLQKAEMGTVLTPEEQQVLEGYYGRYEAQRQERDRKFGIVESGGRPKVDYEALASQAGGAFTFMPGGGVGLDPVSVQQGLRGQYSMAPPKDYMVGFEPEFSYFQNDPNAPFIPDRGYRPTEEGVTSSGDYFDPILDRQAYNQQLSDYYTMLGSYVPGVVEPPGGPGGPGGPETPFPNLPEPENPYNPEPPEDSPYGDRYDAWRRNSDYILDKVRRGVPLTDSESNWFAKYEAGLIVDPRFRPEGFQVPASFEEAMALYNSGGYDGIQTVPFGALDDFDRGKEEQYPSTSSSQPKSATSSQTGSKTGSYSAPSAKALSYFGGDSGGITGLAGFKNALQGLISGADARLDGGPKGGIAAGPAYESDIIEPGKNIATIVRGSDDEYADLSPEEKEYMQEAYILKFQAQANSGNQNVFSDDNYDYRRYLELGYPPLSEEDKERIGVVEMQAGGEVPIRTPMGEVAVPEGGVANIPTEFSASMPTEQEFQMVAAAIAGVIDNGDAVIEMFVQKYGPEMFAQIRDMVLQSIQPNAQTQGMIEGPGGGMDDMVGGMIGAEQPVAVSPGEYIVPADVVSGIGDGSSDAGAQELDAMMARVRMARGGTTEQAPAIDAQRMMPA